MTPRTAILLACLIAGFVIYGYAVEGASIVTAVPYPAQPTTTSFPPAWAATGHARYVD